MSRNGDVKVLLCDCDGSLVDNEAIACAVIAEHLGRLGYVLSPQQYILRFAGLLIEEAIEKLDRKRETSFHNIFPYVACRSEIARRYPMELKAAPYVKEILPTLNLGLCVASGSPLDRIEYVLNLTELLPLFGERLYSAKQVARGKPEPDLFLYAAEQMGVRIDQCLSIEDSPVGIRGAKRAGVRAVFAYLGGSHVSPPWVRMVMRERPDAVFTDMRQLPGLVNALR